MTGLYTPFFLPFRSRARRAAPPASPLNRLNALLEILRPAVDHTSADPATRQIIREKLTLLIVDLKFALFSRDDVQRAIDKALVMLGENFRSGHFMDPIEIDTNEKPQTNLPPAWL